MWCCFVDIYVVVDIVVHIIVVADIVVVVDIIVVVDVRRGDVFERNKRSREFLDKSVIYNLT